MSQPCDCACYLWFLWSYIEPEIAHLYQIVLPKVYEYWDDVAVALGYKAPIVSNIEKKYGDLKKCCKALFKDWLSPESTSDVPKTWSTLLNAIKKVPELNETSTGEKILKELAQ